VATIQLRGGLAGEKGTSPLFTLPEGKPTEKLDASTIDVLQVAQGILNGKPYAGAAAAVRLARREKLGVDALGVYLATTYEPAEIAHMFALTLVTLGAK
jgi:hypothetical protein